MAAAQTTTEAQTQKVVDAASGFVESLSAMQRQKVSFPFVPEKTSAVARFARASRGATARQSLDNPSGPSSDRFSGPDAPSGPHLRPADGRGKGAPRGRGMGPPGGFVGERYSGAIRSNFPVSDVPRPGLQLGSLTAPQRGAAMHLLQVLLSPKGYQKVHDIMGSDWALADSGTDFASGQDAYTIGLFGTPSATTPWMVQFGGHHLGLNVVMSGVLAGENDRAFALLDALDTVQCKQAILTSEVGDLVLGPGHDGETILPECVKGAIMNADQKALLLDLITEWAGIVNDAYAGPRMADIKSGLDDTYFAWSGPTTHMPGRNGSSYYSIQGPKLVIEFAPQGVGGDLSMHVHTIYRDPTNEYGRAFTRK